MRIAQCVLLVMQIKNNYLLYNSHKLRESIHGALGAMYYDIKVVLGVDVGLGVGERVHGAEQHAEADAGADGAQFLNERKLYQRRAAEVVVVRGAAVYSEPHATFDCY